MNLQIFDNSGPVKRHHGCMKPVACLQLTALLLGPFAGWSQSEPDPYDALYDSIMVRQSSDGLTSGKDEAAPLLWRESRFLLKEEGFQKLAQALRDFAALSPAEAKKYPALKRALLQRHLWTVFDWTTGIEQREWSPESHFKVERRNALQSRIAPLIRRLALTKAEILALPDTMAATVVSGGFPVSHDPSKPFKPFFPADLPDPAGPWVCLTKSYHTLPAKFHADAAEGRSVFLLFIRLPGDRQNTLQYLKKLTDFEDHWALEKPEYYHRLLPNGGIHHVKAFVNPETPQFPVGTQFALVERALLISDEGELAVSPLTLKVLLRAYLSVDRQLDRKRLPHAVAEFYVSPKAMMDGAHALKAVQPKEFKYDPLLTGRDPFERKPEHRLKPQPKLATCIHCHSAWGIHSVNSRSQLFENRSLLPPRFREGKPEDVTIASIRDKQKRYSWGMLEGMWLSNGR